MTDTPRWLPVQFTALALVWGSSFLFIRVGLDGLSPLQVAAARMVLGALVLAVIVPAMGVGLPRERRAWAHLSVVSLFFCVLPFSLFSWAGQYIDSGLASIYNATTPLMTLAVTFLALRSERPRPAQSAGLMIGLAGVMIVLLPSVGLEAAGQSAVLAQLACLLATASYGIAFVYLRRFVSPLGLPATTVAAVQIGTGAVVLALLVAAVDRQPLSPSPAVVASMLALGVLGTGVAFVWNTNIIAGWGAPVASSVTYLTPVIGVVLGAVVLGERLSWNQPIGAAVVVLGILVSRRQPVSGSPGPPIS